MIIMVHADANQAGIESRLGSPQYSYFFAMQDFLPVIESLGILVQLRDPATEADGVFEFCREIGEACVFLSFTPPHLTEHALACPTIPVFPLEYYDLPAERWNGEDRNDWRWVLGRLGRAITHSSHGCDVIRAAMGADFPVVAIASPVWDRFAPLRREPGRAPSSSGFNLVLYGDVVDSRVYQPLPIDALAAFSASTEVAFNADEMIRATSQGPQRRTTTIHIEGVAYCTDFNPRDGRKNWWDILRTFCLALREHADATLVLKVVHRYDPEIRFS